jgi:hypothetical protein
MSYSTGKIYKIVSKQTDKIYIGSTRLTLEIRFKVHKADYKMYIETNNSSCSSIKLLKYEDCEIVLIELYPCESRTELCRREGLIQLENRGIIVNKCIAGRTLKEYRLDNKEHIAERLAQWHIENMDRVVEYQSQYRFDNRDKRNEQSAQYYLDNKDTAAEYYAQYRLDNKDKLTANFECECGSVVQYGNKAHHFKTDKHKNYLLTI